MSEIKIIDGVQTVFINGKPFEEWGRLEHEMWQQETKDLIASYQRLGQRLLPILRKLATKGDAPIYG